MRAFVPAYELVAPASLAEALSLLGQEPGAWKPFAGGTDLMVLLESGKLTHKKYFNLWNLAELKTVEVSAAHVTLGALTTYSQIQRHETLQQEFPLLCRAAAETGSIATQNRGTLGGNIVNASPAADSPPALMAYAADLELISQRGSRWVALADFYSGYKQMDLQSDELLRSIRLPRMKASWRQFYRKVGARKAQAIAKVCFAGAALLDGEIIQDIRIALGSVAPTVIRCRGAEDSLRGKKPDSAAVAGAISALGRDISPIDDIRSTARYRRQVAGNLLEEFLGRLRQNN